MKLAILHMRSGGVFITQADGQNENIGTLAARLHGGHAVFSDSLWQHPRELAINLADVSVIELISIPEMKSA